MKSLRFPAKGSDFRHSLLNPYFLIPLLLFILIIPASMLERSSKKELDTLKTRLAEFSALSNDYKSIKGQTDGIEQRTSLSKTAGVASAMDDIFSSFGIKGKMKSVKVTGTREMKGAMTEETAEVQLEKVNMNELVNVIHKTENAPMLLSLKKVMIKKSFERPDLLDVTMTISLFSRK